MTLRQILRRRFTPSIQPDPPLVDGRDGGAIYGAATLEAQPQAWTHGPCGDSVSANPWARALYARSGADESHCELAAALGRAVEHAQHGRYDACGVALDAAIGLLPGTARERLYRALSDGEAGEAGEDGGGGASDAIERLAALPEAVRRRALEKLERIECGEHERSFAGGLTPGR